MTQTKFPSEKVIKAYEKFFIEWDDRVETQDDQETEQMLWDILQEAQNKLHLWRSERENKIIQDNAPEKALPKLQSIRRSKWYSDMERISDNLLYAQSVIKHILELKNRRTAECFKLRSDNAKLRMR